MLYTYTDANKISVLWANLPAPHSILEYNPLIREYGSPQEEKTLKIFLRKFLEVNHKLSREIRVGDLLFKRSDSTYVIIMYSYKHA